MTSLKSYITSHKSKVYTLGDQAILSGSTFLLTILLTRSLGLAQVGIYTLVWIVVMFAISINQAVLISPLLIFGAKKRKELDVDHYYMGAFQLEGLFAGVMGVSLGIFMLYYQRMYPEIELKYISLKVGAIVFTYLLNDFFRKYFYLTHNHHKSLIQDGLGYGLLIMDLIIGTFMGRMSLDHLFTTILICQTISMLYGFSRFKLISFNVGNIVRVINMHMKFSFWLVLASVFQWFAGNIFLVVAARELSVEALGAIRIMQNLVGVLSVLFIAIENYVPISAAQIYAHQGYHSLMVYMRQTLVKAGGFFVLLFSGMVLFAKQLIQITYGSIYVSYSYLLIAFVVLYFFVFLSMNLRIGLRAMEHTRPIFISYAIVAAFSLVSAKPIVLLSGDIGVVIGLASCQVMMSLFYIWVIRKRRVSASLAI